MVKCFWATRETEYIGFIVGNGIVRTSPSKVAVKDWPLPETQKQVKSFVSFCSFIVSPFTTLRIVPKVFARACSAFGCYKGCF